MENRAIIKRALRMLGVLASGRDPSAGQASDALEALQAMVNAMAATMGGPWIEQAASADVAAEESDRIRVIATTDITVYLPVSTQGVDRTVDTCGCVTVIERCTEIRAPRDMAKVFIMDIYGTITPRLYIYRADIATWVLANALELDGDSPFGPQHDRGLAAMLAVDLAPEFDQPLSPKVAAVAAQSRLAMLSRFDASRPPIVAEYF